MLQPSTALLCLGLTLCSVSLALGQASIRADSKKSRTLEEAFWRCDYLATVAGPDATPIEYCSAVTTELMNRDFDADIERMVPWWRARKAAEHAKLAKEMRIGDVVRR